MDPSSIGGLSFIGVGGVMLLIAAFFFFRTKRFLRDAVSVQGTVTGLAMGSGSEGGVVYHPVVQFMAMDGQMVQFQDMIGSNPPRHQVGQQVEVKYSPTNPQNARLASKFRLWFVPGLLGGMGLIFAAAGIPWYLSSGGASAGGTAPGEPAAIGVGGVPTGLPTGTGLTPVPPAAEAAGATLTVQDEVGPRTVSPTCEAIDRRKGGKVLAVRLGFEGGTVSFTIRPYRGPGAYTVGQNVKIGGTFLKSGGASGAVIVEPGGRSGILNLVSGTRIVSGQWTCD